MATATVGILRALLTADASAYQATMKKSAEATKSFGDMIAKAGANAQKETGSFTRLEKSFRGDRIINEATKTVAVLDKMGGALHLTAQEQARVNRTLTEAIAKYRAFGQTAPKAMLDLEQATRKTGGATEWLNTKMIAIGTAIGTFASSLALQGVRALGSFALEAFQTAGQISDLAKQTGLSTDSIQEMQAVVAETGQSLDTFTNAAFKLGLALSGNDKSVGRGLQALGLEWEKLRGLSMDEQFRRVMKAAGEMDNPIRRNQALVAIWGERLGRELAKAAEGYTKIADAAVKSSEQQIDALDEAGDRWAKFTRDLSTGFVTAMGQVFIELDKFGKWWARNMPKGFGGIGGLTVPKPVYGPPAPPPPPGPSPEDLQAAEDRAKKAAAAIEALRKSLNALGLVTKRNVNEALAEMVRVQHQAVADGLDLNTVVAAQLPLLKDLVDKAKASGINVDGLTEAYLKAGDAWLKTIDPLFDQVKGVTDLAEATKHLRAEAERLNGVDLPNLSRLTGGLIGGPGQVTSQDVSAPLERLLTFWEDEFPKTVTQAFEGMTQSMSTSLTDMLVGLRGFKDGFLDIWRSIRTALSDILASMLNNFLSGFLKPMLGALAQAMAGRSLAGTALGNALGIGTAAAAGTATAAAAGSAAAFGVAPAATSAAGMAGMASLGWTVGAPTTTGAGIGATIAGLATNPFTIAAAGGLALGLGIWKKGWFRGGEEGTKVNPARDAFLRQYGGFNSLAALLTSVTGEPGGGRLFQALTTARTMKAFTAATSNIQTLLARRGVATPSASPSSRWPGSWADTSPAMSAAAGPVMPSASMPVSAATAGGGAVTMNVTIQAWDRADLNDAFREEIIPRFKDALQMNQAGMLTAIRQGVG